MELRQLRYFLHAAETQSLTRAASLVRVAQPALSRQIKALEEELNVTLLTRHGWGVSPTAAGRVLMNHARQVLTDVSDARDAVLAFQAEPSGSLSLGVPTSLSQFFLPLIVSSLRRLAPKVQIRFVDGFSATIHEWLAQGRIDMAVIYNTRQIEGLSVSPLFEEEMALISSASRPIGPNKATFSDLAALDLLVPSRPNRLRLLIDEAFSFHAVSLAPVCEIDALPALIELVRMGEGFTLLPLSAVYGLVKRGELHALPLSIPIRRSLMLARLKTSEITPAKEALQSVFFDVIRSEAPTYNWSIATNLKLKQV